MRFWNLYDQCCELIEDVDDMSEDGRDWNFNFWLYSYMAGRSCEAGIAGAREALYGKFCKFEDALLALRSRDRDDVEGIFRRTAARGLYALQYCQQLTVAITARPDVVFYGRESKKVSA